MSRYSQINNIRKTLEQGGHSIGSWMQIPNASVAEILGHSGYDWVAVDMEHGAIDLHQLPDIFRALELGDTLPLVRVAEGTPTNCKQALDAGAGGVVIPMVTSSRQLETMVASCQWPPAGNRGVGFSRANLFGEYFDDYVNEAQTPFIVAMIESIQAIDELDGILQVKGLDAIFIGPYDLSASMNLTADFRNPDFTRAIDTIMDKSRSHGIPCGIHVVNPDDQELRDKIDRGYRFIAYSVDSVFMRKSFACPHEP